MISLAALTAVAARPIGKAALIALGIAGLLAIGGLGAWRAAATVQAMVDDAAATAKAERDAHWRSEIAEANVKVAQAEVEQARAAMTADTEVKAAETRREEALKELETKNATLADSGRCGLGRDRVRLLNNSR
ncbi:ABC-type branched-subunit amino acid transport system substrate-binding protein [Rhodopseudomonas rhenobacensis]|uniref:ABC-type branched-subunit amino acid transport system substrate-binding protein n=1 Tax=Rhodopseudomonas rhenobacensis TaxID=87461 RepID=A0A7W8DY03_9BRAD|nr:hypothetical protein [Rhodopseudomonas rhenobacensis]MBB5046774.1 ABC-type branched-subunit amino acid transport system substrate-binding protein [Rhodopseudomonas rhenobacensis]